MTSKNSINLKDLGFPKWFSFKTFNELEGKLVHVQFRRNRTKEDPHYRLIKDYEIRVGTQGFVEYNFDCDLHEGDLMQIIYSNPVDHENIGLFIKFILGLVQKKIQFLKMIVSTY